MEEIMMEDVEDHGGCGGSWRRRIMEEDMEAD